MDMRNGAVYESVEAAKAAGVPNEHIAEVESLVRVTSGPFKGRVYQRTVSGLRRLKRLEALPAPPASPQEKEK